MYVPNDTFSKHKAKVYRLKEKIDKLAIIVMDFNTSLAVTDRTSRQKN